MKKFHVCNWFPSHNHFKISAILAIKYNIIFADFLEMLLDNNVTFALSYVRWLQKSFRNDFSLYF